MHNGSRLVATIVIWGAFTIIGLALVIGLARSPSVYFTLAFLMVAMFIALLVGVTRATVAIWANMAPPEESYKKTKRTQNHRVRRLVESLNDDEIYELESMLLNQSETNHYGHS